MMHISRHLLYNGAKQLVNMKSLNVTFTSGKLSSVHSWLVSYKRKTLERSLFTVNYLCMFEYT